MPDALPPDRETWVYLPSISREAVYSDRPFPGTTNCTVVAHVFDPGDAVRVAAVPDYERLLRAYMGRHDRLSWPDPAGDLACDCSECTETRALLARIDAAKNP